MLSNLERTASRILDLDLYSFLKKDILSHLGTTEPTVEQVVELLEKEPRFLDEYGRLNRDNDISNIDLAVLPLSEEDSPACRQTKQQLNRLRDELIALEKFSGRPSWVMYSIWIGFGIILLLFLAHNIYAIYTDLYSSAPTLVFGSYALITAAGVGIVFWMMRRHQTLQRRFRNAESRFEKLSQQAIQEGCIHRTDLFPPPSPADEHPRTDSP